MKPSDRLVCSECGARNKAAWEFCARCGEPLLPAPASAPKTVRAVAAAPAAGLPWGTLGGLLGVVLLAVVAWTWRPPPPAATAAAAAVFTVPTDQRCYMQGTLHW